jgi:ribose transport system ATP-binding protein
MTLCGLLEEHMKEKMLELKNISKSFPGVKALSNVNIDLYKGEVLGICGENGAGKSTLIKIIGGIYEADEGSVHIQGEKLTDADPNKADKLGVAIIHQELSIVPTLNIEQNLFLGHLPTKNIGIIDFEKLNKDSCQILVTLGLDINPRVTFGSDLSISKQQVVEIGKALARNAKILVMDEPTSSLSKDDVERLFEIIQQFKQKGYGIIYVSHHLEEIFRICDRVSVLRDGKLVETRDIKEWNNESMVYAMVNRKVSQQYPYKKRTYGDVILEAENISNEKLRPSNLVLRKHEIIGVAGVVGAGRTELLKTLYGVYPAIEGKIKYKGYEVSIKSPKQALDKGIVMVPEDRKKEALMLALDVVENTVLSHYKNISKYGIVDQKKKQEITRTGIKRFNIKTPSLNQKVEQLSGGNQQKVILSRVTYGNPEIFLLDEPTRGIDVNVKADIYQEILNIAENGAAVIWTSSSLLELLGISDRILVMRNHEIVADIPREVATQELITNYTTGGIANG